MIFVSITRLRVRSWRFFPAFAMQTLRIARQARKAEGNLAARLLRDRHNTFWTATSWTSETSMRNFMRAAPHGPTMRNLLEWCDEAALVHWTQSGVELPAWEEAHRRMQVEGRSSKVNHPSKDQLAYIIPAPAPSQNRELAFK